jgi:hypothetical protein
MIQKLLCSLDQRHKRLLGALNKHRKQMTVSARRALNEQRKEMFGSAVAKALQGAIFVLCGVFGVFLAPAVSGVFIVSLVLVGCAFILFVYKRYLFATATFLCVVALVAMTSMTASYFIASDQSRLRYRVVDGISYVEFPAQISFLASVFRFFGSHKLIVVDACGGTKVAKLPLLQLAPLYADNDLFRSPFGFRRIPASSTKRLI